MWAGIAIIEDHQLRIALIENQQKLGTVKENTENTLFVVHNLPIDYPNLIKPEPYLDESLGEMRAWYQCDLDEIRKSQGLLVAASKNVDGGDAYLRDGLCPWSTYLTHVHHVLEKVLGIEHAEG